MTIYETLTEMLQNHGVTTEYTESQLDSFIKEAKILIDVPCLNDRISEDYIRKFKGDVYCTREYPLIKDSVVITLNDEQIEPSYVTEDGIIYFDKTVRGILQVNYTVGLSEEEINEYLLPVVVCLIEDKEGLNISSVSEGDVSVSYNNANGYTSRTLDSLIENLRNKYCARVRLI